MGEAELVRSGEETLGLRVEGLGGSRHWRNSGVQSSLRALPSADFPPTAWKPQARAPGQCSRTGEAFNPGTPEIAAKWTGSKDL